MTFLTETADESHLSSIYACTLLKANISILLSMQKAYKSVLWLFVVHISCITMSFAQFPKNTPPAKSKIEISGNFIVATDFESVYTSYGGPAVKFSFSKELYACISMYPGLRWKNDPVKSTVLPILGTVCMLAINH